MIKVVLKNVSQGFENHATLHTFEVTLYFMKNLCLHNIRYSYLRLDFEQKYLRNSSFSYIKVFL